MVLPFTIIKEDCMSEDFRQRKHRLFEAYETLVQRPNEPVAKTNGVFQRYKYPILTAEHTPVFWRYDLNPETNPYLMERFGINATFNSGAMKWQGKYLLIVRVE